MTYLDNAGLFDAIDYKAVSCSGYIVPVNNMVYSYDIKKPCSYCGNRHDKEQCDGCGARRS